MEIARIETQKVRLFFIVIWSKKNFLTTVGQIHYAAAVFCTGRFLVKLGKYAETVSYTHLDVYKRQVIKIAGSLF